MYMKFQMIFLRFWNTRKLWLTAAFSIRISTSYRSEGNLAIMRHAGRIKLKRFILSVFKSISTVSFMISSVDFVIQPAAVLGFQLIKCSNYVKKSEQIVLNWAVSFRNFFQLMYITFNQEDFIHSFLGTFLSMSNLN